MGIYGLNSFIKKHPNLLKDHELHDCRVVIDGNNFYYFLFLDCDRNVRFQFGGDYDAFQRKIVEVFDAFKLCNVEAFLVFDGAYTVDGKKFETTMKHARSLISADQDRSRSIMDGRLIPCLKQVAFKQTLDELGIQHVTCDFEADSQLVTLANQWNCPVISSDSDFFVFELSGGFIPLHYIDFLPHKSAGRAFFNVNYYHVDDFVKCFSVNRNVLPLFATMLGNDYIDVSTFKVFYSMTFPRGNAGSRRQMEIASLLQWLAGKEQLENIVSEVLTSIPLEQRTEVEALMKTTINGYRDIQDFESFDLKTFLEGDRAGVTEKTDLVTSAQGERLPAWFVAACRRGDVPVILLHLALSRWIILPTQVEGKDLPASFLISTVIRKVIYGMLLGRSQSHQPMEARLPDTNIAQSHQPMETRLPDTNIAQSHQPMEARLPDTNIAQSHQPMETRLPDTIIAQSHQPLETRPPNSDTVQAQPLNAVPPQTCNIQYPVRGSPESDKMPSSSEAKETDAVKSSAEFSSDNMSSPNDVEATDTVKSSTRTSSEETDVLEYTRHITDLRSKRVRAQFTLPMFGKLPALERVNSLSEGDRRAIFLETLGVTADFSSKFDPHLQQYMACLVFWARNAEPSVTLCHLKGVILSALLLHVHKEIADREHPVWKACVVEKRNRKRADAHPEPGSVPAACGGSVPPQPAGTQKEPLTPENRTKCSPEISITRVCSAADDKTLVKVRDNLKEYYDNPVSFSKRIHPDHETFHRTAQFQACLYDANLLNFLLQSPLPTPQPTVLINGSFIYTIIRRLHSVRMNPERFLSNWLVKGSVFADLFYSLWSEVVAEAGEEVFK